MFAQAGFVAVLKALAIDDQIARLAPDLAFTPRIGRQPDHFAQGSQVSGPGQDWRNHLAGNSRHPRPSARRKGAVFPHWGGGERARLYGPRVKNLELKIAAG